MQHRTMSRTALDGTTVAAAVVAIAFLISRNYHVENEVDANNYSKS